MSDRVRLGFKIISNLVKLAIALINQKALKELRDVRERYSSDIKRVAELHIVDIGYRVRVKLEGDSVVITDEEPTAGAELTLDTLLDLIAGETKVLDQATGEVKIVSYTPLDAWRWGDVKVWGYSTTSDVIIFLRDVWDRIQPLLKQQAEIIKRSRE